MLSGQLNDFQLGEFQPRQRPNRTLNNFLTISFCLSWIWIAFVGSVDTYLTIYLQLILEESEQNPLARFILDKTNWNVSLFIGIKMFATIMVLGTLALLFLWKRKWAMTAVYSIAIFQAGLLFYLIYDHHHGLSSFFRIAEFFNFQGF